MMKKNRMMRLASGLLVVTLLTTCIISGTFAKYTTEGSTADTARVAQFGVVLTTGGSLFSNAYLAAESNLPTIWNADSIAEESITVATASDSGLNIVAPGTASAHGLSFGVSGTPEVAVQMTGSITARDIYLESGYTYAVMEDVTDEVTADNLTSMAASGTLYTKSDGAYTLVTSQTGDDYSDTASYYLLSTKAPALESAYYPVQYSLTRDDPKEGDEDLTKATEIAAEVAKEMFAVESATENDDGVTYVYATADTDTENIFPAGTNLGEAKDLGGLDLTWVWDFDNNGDGTYDAYDTILGDMIAFAKADTAEDAAFVVYATDDGYADVVYATDGEGNYTIAKDANDTILASLSTAFDIKITVTQVD